MAWVTSAPKTSGHYWVMLQYGTKPAMVYINNHWDVCVFASRQRLSIHSDIKLWWADKVAAPEVPKNG